MYKGRLVLVCEGSGFVRLLCGGQSRLFGTGLRLSTAKKVDGWRMWATWSIGEGQGLDFGGGKAVGHRGHRLDLECVMG